MCQFVYILETHFKRSEITQLFGSLFTYAVSLSNTYILCILYRINVHFYLTIVSYNLTFSLIAYLSNYYMVNYTILYCILLSYSVSYNPMLTHTILLSYNIPCYPMCNNPATHARELSRIVIPSVDWHSRLYKILHGQRQI